MEKKQTQASLREISKDAMALEIFHEVVGMNRLQDKKLQTALSGLSVHPAQYSCLFAICQHDGLNLGELAQLLHIENSTASVSVKRMEKAGLVERRPDGIVVCGAKVHQTGSINSHWHIFMPTIAMGEADKDFAVSFACPTDAEGMYMIYGRQSCDTRKLEGGTIDLGNAKFGGQEALVVLDHVFIPKEYIFLNGEYEFAGMMVERFAGYHRQSYGGCKVGVGDVVIGAAALAAEYNGVEKASHIKDKLIEMTHLNETLYSCGIACSCEGCPTKAGNYQIDLLLANVCKQNITRFPYEIVRLAEDIAGGLMVTMPSQQDFESDTAVGMNGETIGEICNKFFAAREGVSTENRQRIMRFLENICLGSAAVGYRTESLHGAGSPQAQRIMIARQGDIPGKKALAKTIAGIKK